MVDNCCFQHFRDRWSTLKSVDEVLQAVYDKVEQAGQLERTVFIYMSDHGKLCQQMIVLITHDGFVCEQCFACPFTEGCLQVTSCKSPSAWSSLAHDDTIYPMMVACVV